MKISIITATFNRENTISQALSSLKSQSYKNYEHIVVDGLSKDKTLQIIKEQKDERTFIKSEQDRGIYDAFNKGLLRSTGDIIGFLHSDDFYPNSLILEKVLNAFKTYNCDLLFGNLEYVSQINHAKVIRQWHSGSFSIHKLKNGWMPPHPTVFFKRSLLEIHGLFDLNYHIAADYEYLIRYLKIEKLKVHYIPESLMTMRMGGTSNGSLRHAVKKSCEDYEIIKKYHLYSFSPFVTLMMKNLRKITQFI